MSLLVLGISHRSAPMAVLDRAALDTAGVSALREAVVAGDYVEGVAVLATCNRLELIADVSAFHGGLADLGTALVETLDVPWPELSAHLYAHFDDRALEHLLHVACGLDSMALGEAQILGQVRAALSAGQQTSQLTGDLSFALQQALRVGKRAHSETGLDQVARSLLTTALETAPGVIGDLHGARALVVGAGAMAGLVTASLGRLGLKRITVLNRTLDAAERLAAGVGGRPVAMTPEALTAELADADLVISCTGARGTVIEASHLAVREGAPTFLVDLALPRDIDTAVRELPGAELVGLDDLAERLRQAPHQGEEITGTIAEVRAIIAQELRELSARQRARDLAPTVKALRRRAQEVLDAENSRLRAKLGDDVDPRVLDEVTRAMRRVADKIMHTPTVRAKELAADPDGVDYATLLGTLFDLPTAEHIELAARVEPATITLTPERRTP